MKLHLAGAVDIDPAKFEQETLSKLKMPSEIVMRHRIPQFGHIFRVMIMQLDITAICGPMLLVRMLMKRSLKLKDLMIRLLQKDYLITSLVLAIQLIKKKVTENSEEEIQKLML